MNRFAVTCVAFVLGLGAALASSGGFVGNTIHSSTVGFGELSFYVDPDGSYQMSDGSDGSWTYDGETLCFDELCGPFDGSKGPGDSWEDTAWDGDGMAQLSIDEGNTL